MNKTKLGAKLRIARLRLGLRQVDVAARVRVSRETVSRAERGLIGALSIDLVERLADAVNLWFDGDLRSRSGDVDRMLNAAHNALGEQVVAWIADQPGWRVVAEVTFAIGREMGAIDVLAYHEATRQVAVIELKTTIFDVDEHLGTLSRKERLALDVARQQGWPAESVSVWLIVSECKTNRRRVAAHRALIASRLPADGRRLRGWFGDPSTPIRGVAFWTDSQLAGAGPAIVSPQRAPSRRRGRLGQRRGAGDGPMRPEA